MLTVENFKILILFVITIALACDLSSGFVRIIFWIVRSKPPVKEMTKAIGEFALVTVFFCLFFGELMMKIDLVK